MDSELQHILDILRRGGTILFPTDTIWGLGCDATNSSAVDKVFGIKKRESNKALVILLNNENKLFDYVKDVPDIAFDLIDLNDKPLTIIYPDAKNLPSKVIGSDGSVAIRICKDESCGDLLYKFRKPLVATSANLSGGKAPIDFSDIPDQLLNRVDAVYRKEFVTGASKPSQIIKLNSDGSFEILRH